MRRTVAALAFAFAATVALGGGASPPALAAEHDTPPVDTPALDPAPVRVGTAEAAGTGASDADRLGGFALAAGGVLLLVALAARFTGHADRDVCPLCKATLALSGRESRCGRCGFRVVRTRPGDAFFGRAAPGPATNRTGGPGAPAAGGARGTW